ncbi:MAG: hypothetical protein ACTH5M_10515, partial [Psychrobacter sp.]
QSRLAENNIRINNNMLVDDSFTYVVGTQNGQVRTRIAGQPALVAVVADVMAGSVLQSAMNSQSAQREATQNNNTQPAPIREPREVTPIEPIRPTEPATPPTIDNPSNPTDNNTAASQPEVLKEVPEDESIDMVITQDENATY